MKMESADKVFRLKKPCPYCGSEMSVQATGWQMDDNNEWFATDLDMNCEAEPDIDSKKWASWSREHGDNDFNEAWHARHDAVLHAMKQRVRFDLKS
jgi:hypothetical protein